MTVENECDLRVTSLQLMSNGEEFKGKLVVISKEYPCQRTEG